MKRIIIKTPATTTLEALTPEQQAAIQGVFSQWVMPMPGSQPAAGDILLDAVVADSFDPANIPLLGLPFTIMGAWQWDGASDLVELQPVDVSFITYLPDTHTYSEQGEVLTTKAPVLHEPHRWSGWPEINL